MASSSSPELPLSNLRCLVTGASSGIGRATCVSLSEQGARVIGVGRNEASLKELEAGGKLHGYVVADLVAGGEGTCERVVSEAVELLGGSLTTLVNNAGVLAGGAAGDPGTDLSNYKFNMTLNTQIPFEMMHHSVPHLEEHPNVSSIVNVSSVNGKQAFAKCVAYCMSKAALDMMARCASVDLAPKGIRVNNVNPGCITTNIHTAGGRMNDEQYAAFVKRSVEVTHPFAKSLGRMGESSEVAEVISFLVGDKAKFLTGECIAIDGARQNLGSR
eukprot:CAMPEP_0201132586 /NCGR_PEP_ID=MMETSP0850-20130426/46229_1 /ASSEMBLY_ACC=CAM_ASM_000622 /TAXON_ID=183588 /ORGANISM="Pseudo-nitzschia fraudulenta, Strain WWA7" /LENGTH=272 /DNA_ID=CAMNT_0047402963 /DNA_START=89 /DNA_END=907 /DNA_ORIENTATION=-